MKPFELIFSSVLGGIFLMVFLQAIKITEGVSLGEWYCLEFLFILILFQWQKYLQNESNNDTKKKRPQRKKK